MTDTEIDDEVDTTKIETETKTEQEEEEFDLEDSSNHLQEAHSEQPTGEGEVEAEVVTTDQTETVSNNTANGRTLWQQSTRSGQPAPPAGGRSAGWPSGNAGTTGSAGRAGDTPVEGGRPGPTTILRGRPTRPPRSRYDKPEAWSV